MAFGIILCGASSIGKTTTAKDWVRRHPEYSHIEEVARSVMAQHSITREDMKQSLETKEKTTFLELQCYIIEEQNRRELSVEGSFISDRGPDPIVFAEHYVSREAADRLAQSPAARACLQRYKRCLVGVLCPLAEPTDDGVRLVETRSKQVEFTEFLRGLLDRYHIPHIYIDVTDRKQRLATLELAIKKGKLPLNLNRLEHSPLNVPFVRPQRSSQQKSISLRQLEISPDGVTTGFSYFAQGESNRMVDRYGQNRLLVVDFHRKVLAKTVLNILRQGLWVSGEEYQFLGCSSSGLRKRTCYMLRGTKEDVEAVWKECGDFTPIKSVSKRLKRIGQLFSAAKPTHVDIQDDNVIEIDDIGTEGGNFTDGCGAIGTGLAKRVMEEVKCQHEEHDEEQYFPSVYQIRYQGCKGVVIRDPNVADTKLLIRKSMKKFNPGTNPFRELWLCDHSRPYSFGHLNRQFIMLLSGLGIKDEVFIKMQKKHFERLETMLEQPDVAIKMFLWNNQPDVAGRVSRCSSIEEFKADTHLQKEVSCLQSKLLEKMEKLRLLVVESRNVFGVCDPLNVLEYGECFFRPTIRGKPMTLSAYVTVCKNPCYLLGDIRVLRAVDNARVQGLEHLVDCIVFPTKGKRPHSAEIAGSDLDGDQYFVCWDKDLIVPNLREPYSYPSDETLASTKVTREMMIDYFAHQNNQSSTMGKIDAYFKYWADQKGVECKECVELGERFSHSVDSAKTGAAVRIPQHLQPPKASSLTDGEGDSINKSGIVDKCSSIPEPVWKKMERAAEEKKRELSEKLALSHLASDTSPAVSEKFIWSLVQDDKTNMSEFELFRFVQRWCFSTQSEEEMVDKLQQFSEYTNFGEFTVDQQVAAIDAGIPKEIVTNALNKSKLLTEDMLSQFSLHAPHCGWRFYLRSSSAEFDWQHLLRGVHRQCHSESMVIFKFPDGMSTVLHFLSPLQDGLNPVTAGSVVAYFFSTHFGLSRRHILGPKYRLDLSNELLQLDRGSKEATFICLKTDEALLDEMTISIDIRRTLRVGEPHPKIRKKVFQCVEVFVKSDSHEPAYLDIYVANQAEEMWPAETIAKEEIEELPSDDEDDREQATEPITPKPFILDAAISALQQSAHVGNCRHFLLILQTILSQQGTCNQMPQPPVLHEALQSLLVTMVSKHAHKLPTPDVLEALQDIVTSVHHYSAIHSPDSCLQLLMRLSQLHCFELAHQMTTPFLTNLQVLQISKYLEIVSHWQQWYYLPWECACHIAISLYSKLCQSFIEAETPGESLSEQTSEPATFKSPEKTLEQLANSQDVTTSADHLQIQRYTSYFAHLLICHFLNEVHDSVTKTDSHLVLLRAYDYKDPHQETDQSESSGNESENTWRIEFSGRQSINSKNFTMGTFVGIYLMKQTRSSSFPVALGRIAQVSNHPACIVVDVFQPTPHCLVRSVQLNKGHWELRLVGNVTTFVRAVDALRSLLDCNKRSTELLPLLVHPDAFPPVVPADVDSSLAASTGYPALTSSVAALSVDSETQDSMACLEEFNHSQQQAISAALKRRLTLIHGPPGTGKTHVACEIVCRLCRQLKEDIHILVAAETNMAVDNLTRKLLQRCVRVVRVGKQGYISPDVRVASLDHQLDMKRIELGKAKQKSPFPDAKMVKKILSAAEVVATTCAGAGDSALKGMTFPFVLIDEATQATEPISLLPALKHCQQLVLIGDPQQLAPTIAGTNCVPEGVSNDGPEISNLSVTLFHRLQRVLPSFFLEEQHRMHPALAAFPSKYFYRGKLKTAASVHLRPSLQTVKWLKHDKPLVFIDVSGSHEMRVGTSFKNSAEAEMVVQVVMNLLSCEVSSLEIAVLTPYSSQVRCIREKLSSAAPKQLEVCTIDSFQGREKDVIVFSTVRSKQCGIPFASDKYRMNVLLTRAKRGLVGIGSKAALECEGLWANWLEQVCVLTEDEFGALFKSKSSDQASSKSHQHCREPGGSEHREPGDQDRRKPRGYHHRGQDHSRSTGQSSRSQSYRQPGAVDQDHRPPGGPQHEYQDHRHPRVHDHSGHNPRGGGHHGHRGHYRPPRGNTYGAVRDEYSRDTSGGNYGRPRDGWHRSSRDYAGGSRGREHRRK